MSDRKKDDIPEISTTKDLEGFKKALKIQLIESDLTDYELDLAKIIKKERFFTEEWNFFGKSSI